MTAPLSSRRFNAEASCSLSSRMTSFRFALASFFTTIFPLLSVLSDGMSSVAVAVGDDKSGKRTTAGGTSVVTGLVLALVFLEMLDVE